MIDSDSFLQERDISMISAETSFQCDYQCDIDTIKVQTFKKLNGKSVNYHEDNQD